MTITESINIGKNNYLILAIILIFNILVQILLVNISQSIFIVVGYNMIILAWICYKNYINNFITLLLFLTIIPFVYIDKIFSRHYSYIVIQNLPLAILLVLAIFYFIHKEKSFQIKVSYVLLPVLIYISYSIVLAIYGVINQADHFIIFVELYQSLYFLFAIPIAYLLVDRKQYDRVFNITIIVFLIIAVEYIISYLTLPYRFTTYHNHIFPLILAILFSGFLFKKLSFIQKFILLVLITILFMGSLATGTRTLLVTNVIAMIIVLFFYFKYKKKKFPFVRIILITVVMLTALLSFSEGKSTQQSINNTTEERFKSISNPIEDVSFLMRIEAVYLGIQEIIENPLFGKGYGYQLHMKWLMDTKYIFPDNNYIYFWLKGGIVFLLIVLWMYFRLFKQCYIILIETNSLQVRYYMVGIIAGMATLMIFAFMNANLIKLKLNIIYAFIFAYVNYEGNQLEKGLNKE